MQLINYQLSNSYFLKIENYYLIFWFPWINDELTDINYFVR